MQAKLAAGFQKLDMISGGRLGIFTGAYRQFLECRAPDAASSLAFWWVFSLFPILAVIAVVASFFVDAGKLIDVIVTITSPILPFSTQLIALNIIRFLRLRSAFGVVGTLGFVWSSSNVFMILYTNINVAWDKARFRNLIQRRLIALGMVAVILAGLLIFLLAATAVDVLRSTNGPLAQSLAVGGSGLVKILTGIAPSLASFIVFFMLYRFIPNTRVAWRDALWAALICAGLWEVTSTLFSFYLKSGLTNYDVVFGSLATLTVTMLWFYLNSTVLLLGAHLSSAINRRRIRQAVENQAPPADSMN